jgi:cytoskeletal protein RodZ
MTKNLFFLLFKNTKKTVDVPNSEPGQQITSTLNSEPGKQIAEIGAQLRQFREQHQITLERVSVVTMIRSRLLEAIEAGELDELPEPIYTQGLIKRYAEAMGFDSEEFANFCSTEPLMQKAEKTPWRDATSVQLRPTHLYLFYVLVIVAAVNGLSQVMNRSEMGEKAVLASKQAPQPSVIAAKNMAKPSGNARNLAAKPLNISSAKVKPPSASEPPMRDDYASSPDRFLENSSEIVAISPSVKPTPLETVATPASVKATNTLDQPKNQAVTISVTVKEETWAMIEVDGKTEFEGNLPVGTQRTWQAKEQLIFRAGNAGGVLFAVNNGKAKPLGQPGEIEEVVLKAKDSPPIAKGKDQG